MKYTERIHNTIDLVSSLHANQKRKGSDTPYVSHCFGVAFILSNYTSDEDIIIAGLLHDVLEDIPGYTKEKMEEKFGKRVADLVDNVTGPKEDESGVKMDWLTAKEIYFNKISNGSLDALLIVAADKIHNMLSVISLYEEEGGDIWKHFKGSKEQQRERYSKIFEFIKSKIDNHILEEYEVVLNKFYKITQND